MAARFSNSKARQKWNMKKQYAVLATHSAGVAAGPTAALILKTNSRPSGTAISLTTEYQPPEQQAFASLQPCRSNLTVTDSPPH